MEIYKSPEHLRRCELSLTISLVRRVFQRIAAYTRAIEKKW